MPSDNGGDEAEKVVERESIEESETLRETRERERLESRQRDYERIQEIDTLSEAAVDLVFHFFEGLLIIAVLVFVILTATTTLSLYTAAGGCFLFVGVLEVIRRSIKSVDKFRQSLLRPLDFEP